MQGPSELNPAQSSTHSEEGGAAVRLYDGFPMDCLSDILRGYLKKGDLSARPLKGKDGGVEAKDLRREGEKVKAPGTASAANNLLVWRKSALSIIVIGWIALIATGEMKVAIN
eukprot:3699903-Prymnesium_polylepis.2